MCSIPFVIFFIFSFPINLIETSPQKMTPAAVAAPTVTHHVQSGTVNGITSPPKAGTTNGTIVPPEDRYSALKDLDALFTTTAATTHAAAVPISEPAVATSNWTPSWNAGTAQVAPPSHSEPVFATNNGMDASTSAWPSVFTPSSNPSNPFLGK